MNDFKDCTDENVGFGLTLAGPAPADPLEHIRARAERGDGSAARYLGDCYREGHPVPLRPRQAFRWYVRGSLAGDADAMNNLGACYHNGFGCPKDMAKAIHWYRRSARGDCTEALDNLGRCYRYGDGVPEDWYQAADIFRQAAAKGHPKAAERLAEMGLKLEPEEREGYDSAIEVGDE